MSLPVVDSTLPRVVAAGSGELTRDEADDIYVEQADATGYDDILTATLGVAKTDAPGYDDILTATAAASTYVAAADVFLAQAQRATIAYTDTLAKDLFTLPSGAVILGFFVNVTTAFDDSGSSDLLDIGDGTTADRFIADKDVGTAGISLVPSVDETALGAETVVKGVYTPGTGATAGAATITVLYLVP